MMDGKTLAVVSIAGMGLNLVGLLMLFRFALPYKTRTGGAIGMALEQKDEAEARRERLYDKLAWLGLAVAVVGTGLQAWSTAVQGKLL